MNVTFWVITFVDQNQVTNEIISSHRTNWVPVIDMLVKCLWSEQTTCKHPPLRRQHTVCRGEFIRSRWTSPPPPTHNTPSPPPHVLISNHVSQRLRSRQLRHRSQTLQHLIWLIRSVTRRGKLISEILCRDVWLKWKQIDPRWFIVWGRKPVSLQYCELKMDERLFSRVLKSGSVQWTDLCIYLHLILLPMNYSHVRKPSDCV